MISWTWEIGASLFHIKNNSREVCDQNEFSHTWKFCVSLNFGENEFEKFWVLSVFGLLSRETFWKLLKKYYRHNYHLYTKFKNLKL